MLYRALSLSLLFSLSVSAGDKPPSPGHVEMAKGNPQNSPQMPQVEFQQPYANQSPSSSNVGSNVGGSIVNVLLDLGKVEQPDIAKLRAAKVDEDFRAALAKYGPHVTAQFYPQYFDNMGNLKGSDPMADFVKFVSSRTPVATPAPIPAPEPVVSRADADSANLLTSKLAQAHVTPSPLPKNDGPGAMQGMGGAAAGGIMVATKSGAWASMQSAASTTGTVVVGVLCSEAAIAVAAGLAIGAAIWGTYEAGAWLWRETNKNYMIQMHKDFPHDPRYTPKTSSNQSGGSSGGSPTPKKPNEPKERVINQVQRTEAINKLKKDYRYDNQTNKYILKENGKPVKCTITGKDVYGVDWDGAHGDIEAYRDNGKHLGSLDPETFEMYKGPVATRRVDL